MFPLPELLIEKLRQSLIDTVGQCGRVVGGARIVDEGKCSLAIPFGLRSRMGAPFRSIFCVAK
jgi:hypothetical protein